MKYCSKFKSNLEIWCNISIWNSKFLFQFFNFENVFFIIFHGEFLMLGYGILNWNSLGIEFICLFFLSAFW